MIPFNSSPILKSGSIVEADGSFLRSGSAGFSPLIQQSVVINLTVASSGVISVSMTLARGGGGLEISCFRYQPISSIFWLLLFSFLARANAKMLPLHDTAIPPPTPIQRAEAGAGAHRALARPGRAPRAADADADRGRPQPAQPPGARRERRPGRPFVPADGSPRPARAQTRRGLLLRLRSGGERHLGAAPQMSM